MKASEFIKFLRIKKGLSCRELSRLSGISHSTISDIENGICHPSLFTILKLCNGLGTDIFDFLSVTNYFKEEKISVGTGDIFNVYDNKLVVDFDNGIEEYVMKPEFIYVKGLSNCYLVRRLVKVNDNGKKKSRRNN